MATPSRHKKNPPSKASKNNDPLIAFAPKAKSQSNNKTKSTRILRSNSKVSIRIIRLNSISLVFLF